MARRKGFMFGKEFVQVAKATSKFVRAVNTLSDSLQSEEPTYSAKGANDEGWERKCLEGLGGSSVKYFYAKVVGVTHQNADGSDRKSVIKTLSIGQDLELRREPDNKFDPNAIKVCVRGGFGVGYLEKRLAAEITRSLKRGERWKCIVRRVLHTPGTKNWGVRVFMVKYRKSAELGKSIPVDKSMPPMTGSEFLATYYPDHKKESTKLSTAHSKSFGAGTAIMLFLVLVIIFILIKGC